MPSTKLAQDLETTDLSFEGHLAKKVERVLARFEREGVLTQEQATPWLNNSDLDEETKAKILAKLPAESKSQPS